MPAAVAAWAASAWSGAVVGGFAGTVAAGTVTAVSLGVGTALVYAGTYIAAAAVIGLGISAVSSAIAGKPNFGGLPSGALSAGSPLQMTKDPTPPRRVIYGRTRASGPMLDGFVTGGNDYVHFVIGLADHECEAIEDVFFTDTIEPLDGSGNSTGTYAGYARVKKHLGVLGAAADADFVADSDGQRAASDKFDGIANLYGKFKWEQGKWPSGFPNLSAIVKGKKCYDPRTGLAAWTDNPALCIRDFLTNPYYGLACALSEIDDASFIAAANICDELVPLAAGGSEKRYRLNGTFDTSAEPATVLDKMVETMAGAITNVGGVWICYAGAHATPESSHLTEDDLRGQINIQTKQSMRETCNRVRGTFASPDEQWQPADVVPIVNAYYLAQDGGYEIWRDRQLAFVTSHSQAQRLFKIDLERTRQDIAFQAPCKLTALRYKPGDVVPVDNAEMGWAGKLFVVTGLKFSAYDFQGELALGVDVDFRETAAEVWDWNNGEETTYDPAANTNLVNPMSVATPAAPTLSTSNFVQSDGTVVPRIQAQCVLPSDAFVTSGGGVEWEYKRTADATWLAWTSNRGNLAEEFITDVKSGVSYDVRLRFRNSHRVPGLYSPTSTIVVSNDTTVPAAPTGLSAASGPGCVVLDWDDNTEADLDHYELYRSASNVFGTATLLWSGYASQHADFTAAVGTTYYYWLKASDTTDNLSAAAGSVAGVATSAAGAAGGFTDFVFKRAATIPATPTGDTPAGWSDAPPAADGNPLWMSTGDKTGAGVLVGAWSTPVNVEGPGLIIEYSVDGSTSWHSTFTGGDLYARHKVAGGSFTAAYRIVGEQGPPGAPGADGVFDPGDVPDGAITTIMIQDAAVSNVSSAFTDGIISTNNSAGGTRVAQTLVVSSVGEPICILAGIVWVPLDNFTFTFDIKRNGTSIFALPRTSETISGAHNILLPFLDQPAAGTWTYTLEFTWTSSFYQVTPFSKRFIQAIALKK